MFVEVLLAPLDRLLVILVLEVQLRDGLGAIVDLLGGMKPLFGMRSNARRFIGLLLLDQRSSNSSIW
jgi:hypothetical protein